jgi:diadenylate cyclase
LGSASENLSLAQTIFSKFNVLSLLDILIVAFLFYWLYSLIRETRAVQITYGISLIFAIWIIAKLLQLNVLIFILQNTLTALIVAIPVVFQPELRNALVKIGRTRLTNEFKDLKKKEVDQVVAIIAQACGILSSSKTGALIVLARSDKLKEQVEKGKSLDARLSLELILTIFTPRSPLHDGAIIISGSKIKAAGAVLPLDDNRFSYKYGTRHKAAIGLSSTSDAIVIVVSEESGTVSIAENGQIESVKIEDLNKKLRKLLYPKNSPNEHQESN